MEHLTPQQVQALLGTPEAQALLARLQIRGGAAWQQAFQAIQAGDYTQAQTILKPIFSNHDTAVLADQLKEKLG